MDNRDKLIAFFRAELDSERASGWARLMRIPDTSIWGNLRLFDELRTPDQESLLDCLAGMARARHGLLFGLPNYDHTKHPFFSQWRLVYQYGLQHAPHSVWYLRNVPMLAKYDPASVSQELLDYALALKDLKAPELRKHVKKALGAVGLQKIEKQGGGCYVYHCLLTDISFQLHAFYAGSCHQLQYHVALPEFEVYRHANSFSFERALGMGHGHWDFITEENVDDSMQMLCESIRYSLALPQRIRDFMAKPDDSCR